MYYGLLRRATAVLAGAVLALVAGAASAGPAQAGAFDGDVTNRLPSNYSLHIAELGVSGATCQVLIAPNTLQPQRCRHYWLPSGWADDARLGSNFDVDAFTVGTHGYEVYTGGLHWLIGSGFYFRISDGQNVNCAVESGRPVCRVT